MSKLILETEGETFVILKRRFEASPEDVYCAHMDPALVQQWMLGPEGWTIPHRIASHRSRRTEAHARPHTGQSHRHHVHR